MTNYLSQKAREHAQKQIEKKSKRVYTGFDVATYEATESIVLDAKDKGILRSYKYNNQGYFLVEYE